MGGYLKTGVNRAGGLYGLSGNTERLEGPPVDQPISGDFQREDEPVRGGYVISGAYRYRLQAFRGEGRRQRQQFKPAPVERKNRQGEIRT